MLTLAADESASTEAGVVSVVGSTVYLGNGTDAEAVGSVDETRDGTDGNPLRVNFSSPGQSGWRLPQAEHPPQPRTLGSGPHWA